MTTITLIDNAANAVTGPAHMYSGLSRIRGAVSITVTGPLPTSGVAVETWNDSHFVTTPPALMVRPGDLTEVDTVTFTVENVGGIRARLLDDPEGPVTVTASFG